MTEWAEKLGVSKTGLYIIIILVVAIPLALLLPNKKSSYKPIRTGAKALSAGAASGGGNVAAMAKASAPVSAAAAAPAAAPAQQVPAQQVAPVVVQTATTTAAASTAGAPGNGGDPDRIRRLDPFAPVGKPYTAAETSTAAPATDFMPMNFDFPVVEPAFKLSAIYLSNDGKDIVVVNDQILRKGDKVGRTDYAVDSIDTANMKGITLRNSRNNETLYIGFEAPEDSELVPTMPQGHLPPPSSYQPGMQQSGGGLPGPIPGYSLQR